MSVSTPLRRLRLRLRPRSIRSRITALVTIMAVLLLVPAGMAAAVMARQRLSDMEWRHARRQAAITADDVREGRLANPIVPRVPGADLIQVVAADHRIVASSIGARALPPLTTTWPTPRDPRVDVQSCRTPQVGCVRLSAVLAWAMRGSPAVLAGGRVPSLISTRIFDTFFAIQVAGLISLASWTTWRVTGRTLRPVRAIGAQLATINMNDLSSRVPEPAGHDEIAQLAQTINATLGRLDQARAGLERTLDRQRRFASDASHELRTPIAGLRAQLEDAQLHPEESDMPAVLAQALGDVDRLESIATDLLLLAGLGSPGAGSPVRVDLAGLIRAELSRRPAVHPVHLLVEPGTAVIAVPAHLRRALANLLDNAERHARQDVWVDVRHEEGSVALTVTDDGEGIAEADRERVFHRFTRLDSARSREQGGTGLGLAIAREITQTYGGTLVIEDSPTGGARFALRLPLASRDTEPGTEAPETRGDGRSGAGIAGAVRSRHAPPEG